jgi:colanic acid biosynthesis glycosyl transferase WcaI
MNITIWGINYAPELTGIAPYNTVLCEHLRRHGHEVRMVTSFAYYPAWKKAAADGGKLYRDDVVNGVPVHRCWHYVPARPGTLRRILHEASFVGCSLLRLLCLSRPDVFVVVSPPLLLGAAAWLLTRVKPAPVVFHVQDLQPDAALGLGMLRPGRFMRMLYALEAFAYARAARVSAISGGMLRAMAAKGVPGAKLICFPNGVTLPATLPARGAFRARHGLCADDFLAVYSGNLGVKQGLEILTDAAALATHPRLQLVICGDGAMRPQLEARIREQRLGNVRLLPLQSEAHYLELLVDADVTLVTQQAGTGTFFFPSKLLRSLALARPVLTVADETSELARALAAGGFGVNVPPGRADELARMLDALAAQPERLTGYGDAGRRFVAQFEQEQVFREFTSHLAALVPADEARGKRASEVRA